MARRQLLELGVGSGMIKHYLHCGRLFPVFLRVYALGRPATEYRSVWMAGTLRGGANSVLSGSSCAAAWGMIKPGHRIEVARPAGRTVRTNSVPPHESFHLLIRSTPLVEDDVTQLGPIPVMTPARVLIDLGRDLNRRELRLAFLNAGRSGLLTPQCLRYIDLGGRSFKGRRGLMELVEQWQPGTGRLRSPMESEFLLLCGEYGIPAPKTNHRLAGFEADCFWPGTRIVAELDSRTFHDDGFGFEDDRSKGNALSMAGYTVLRFTRRMISDTPGKVAEVLRAHLAEPEMSTAPGQNRAGHPRI